MVGNLEHTKDLVEITAKSLSIRVLNTCRREIFTMFDQYLTISEK